jgi:uncharacterized protein (TIGR00255 family)
MTGYGRGTNDRFYVEIRSVNHRFSDVTVRVPSSIAIFENRIRDLVKKRIKRGKLYVFVRYEEGFEPSVEIDSKKASVFAEGLKQLSSELDLKDPVRLHHLIQIPGVIVEREGVVNEEEEWVDLEDAVMKAIDMLIEAKKSEGDVILEEIKERLSLVENLLCEAKKHSKGIVEEYRKKLLGKVQRLVGDEIKLDDARLMMEVVMFSERSDITEEISRLQCHIKQFRDIIQDKSSEEPKGRRLDFLSQEMNREMNTINSKTDKLEIIQDVVEMKGELEKIREQIQNIE